MFSLVMHFRPDFVKTCDVFVWVVHLLPSTDCCRADVAQNVLLQVAVMNSACT